MDWKKSQLEKMFLSVSMDTDTDRDMDVEWTWADFST